jgi:hypothetical protein
VDWITLDRELLGEHGFRSILNLLGNEEAPEPGLNVIITVPLEDGYGNDPAVFRRAVESLA